MNVIDLFAGCGGLSSGFLRDGHRVTKAVELDAGIAATYRKNHPDTELLVDDIKNVDKAKVLRRGDADIIIGGPPCQGFSMAGARIRRGFMGDPRNYLFRHYFNIVRAVRPQVFVMENVKGIVTMEGGAIFQEILRIFSDSRLLDGAPYQVHCRLVKAAEFGIPQKRERVILVGTLNRELPFDRIWEQTREDLRLELPDFFAPVTVRDAIGNLGDITEDGIIDNPAPVTPYQAYLATGRPTLTNHSGTKHSRLAVDRMRRVGSGENFTVLNEPITSVHSGAYGRLCWDEPASTITTRFDTPAGGRFIHPEKDRTLSPREAARIQSFPDEFVFCGSRTSICKQIGNAVPPKISFFLARLTDHILGNL